MKLGWRVHIVYLTNTPVHRVRLHNSLAEARTSAYSTGVEVELGLRINHIRLIGFY
jgi:hypothetical protein